VVDALAEAMIAHERAAPRMMNSPGGIILTPGHAPWCNVQRFGDGRPWHDAQPCTCPGFFGKKDFGQPPAVRPLQAGYAQDWLQCEKCGVAEEHAHRPSDKQPVPTLCFNCRFWSQRLNQLGGAGVLVVKSNFYSFNPAEPYVHERKRRGQPSTLGFAGQQWEIQFFSGRRIMTNNLWSSGEVPPFWRPKFPDNASFIWRFRAVVPWSG
jgi:hypothetical protein